MKKLIIIFLISFLAAFIYLTPTRFLQSVLNDKGIPVTELEGSIFSAKGKLDALEEVNFQWRFLALSLFSFSPAWKVEFPSQNTYIELGFGLPKLHLNSLHGNGSINFLKGPLGLPEGLDGVFELAATELTLMKCSPSNNITLKLSDLNTPNIDLVWSDIPFKVTCSGDNWEFKPQQRQGDILLTGSFQLPPDKKLENNLQMSAVAQTHIKLLESLTGKKSRLGAVTLAR